MEVLFVDPQMLSQRIDSVGQNRYLNLGRTGVAFVGGVLFDNRLLFFFVIIVLTFPNGQRRSTKFTKDTAYGR